MHALQIVYQYNTGHKLFQSIYPLVHGLQVTALVLTFRVELQSFVNLQVLCEPGVVNIFDSTSGKDG